jgi:hypothetical protein
MSKKKGNQKIEPIDLFATSLRIAKANLIMNPIVFPKIAAAVELERTKKGAGEEPFKKACREVIKDDEDLIATIWNAILASIMNPINGYCW